MSEVALAAATPASSASTRVQGASVVEGIETGDRIGGHDHLAPFFIERS
jgi:hypothetical protein